MPATTTVAPTDVTTSATLDFSTSSQNMWASGPPVGFDHTFTLLSAGTGPLSGSLEVADTGIQSYSADLTASLQANLAATLGSLGVNYGLNAGFDAPNVVDPGQQFTIDTSAQGVNAASISATFPTLSASLDAVLSGYYSATFEVLGDDLGTVSNPNVDDVYPIASVSTAHSWSFPSNILKDVNFTLSVPTGYAAPSTTVGSGDLPSVTMNALAAPAVLTASTDLLADIQQLFPEDKVFPDGSIDGNTYSVIGLPITGSVDLAQQLKFDPTGVQLQITAPWGATDTVNLGQDATFTVPENWTAPVDLTTKYVLSGDLENSTGFDGQLSLQLTFLSATLDGDTFSPLFSLPSTPLSLYNSGPKYLYNNSFALDGFNTPSSELPFTLGTGDVYLPGDAPVDVTAFSANAAAMIQAAIDTAAGADTTANQYDPSTNTGTAAAVSRDLNAEIVSDPDGIYQLPVGFTVGILEPGSGSSKLIGNSGDMLLAAAPAAGQTDTLVAGNDADTLVGGQSGTVDFVIEPNFTGEIGGLNANDKIELSGVAFHSGATVNLDSGNVLVVAEGGQTYSIQLDPTEDFSEVIFTLAKDGSDGTDIVVGTTVSNGQSWDVTAGNYASGLVILHGGTVNVLSGGSAYDDTVRGGVQNVDSGGSAIGTVVSRGGTQNVSGTDIGATVLSGGSENIYPSGVADGVLVDAGATVTDDGVANSASVSGHLVVFGSASATTLATHGTAVVYSGGVVTATTVASGSTLTISSGGTANGTVDSGALKLWGSANGTEIASGATVKVQSGGLDSGSIVDSGGGEGVASGGTVAGLTISAGGKLTLDRGANASTVVDGGSFTNNGTAFATLILSGGRETVGSGASETSAAIDSGGSLVVAGGGTAFGTVLSGGTLVLQSGASDFANISGALNTAVSAFQSADIFQGIKDITTAVGDDFITFAGSGATLQIGGTSLSGAVLSGFGAGDTIDLRKVTPHAGGTVSVAAGPGLIPALDPSFPSFFLSETNSLTGSVSDLSITEGGKTYTFELHSAGNPTSDTLVLGADGHGGTKLTDLGSATTVAGATGDTIYLTTNDTLNAGASNMVFAAGMDTIDAVRNDTIDVSGTGSLIEETAGPVDDTIVGFAEGSDQLSFAGETTTSEQQVIAAAKVINGNTTLTYPDHSAITLVGVTHVDTGIFS